MPEHRGESPTSTSALGLLLIFVGFGLFLPGVFAFVVLLAGVMTGQGDVLGGTTQATKMAGIAILAVAAGSVIFRKGATLRNTARKLAVVDGWTLLERDSRPPVLYLRSFKDDEKISVPRTPSNVGAIGSLAASLLGQSAGAHRTQEEELVKELGALGPCVAVGDPREGLPDLGASRIYLSDEWQQRVADLMARSSLIVFRVGSQSPGFWWEVDRVRGVAPPERVLFWIPPQAEGGQDPRDVYEGFALTFSKRYGQLPAWREGAKVLRFDHDWQHARLSPSVTPSSKEVWPRPSSAIANRLGQFVLAATVVIVAVLLLTGRLTLRGLLTGALLGDTARSPAAAQPTAPVLERVTQQLNKSLPKMLDAETELTSASAVEGVLIYHYRLVHALAADVDVAALRSLQSTIAKGDCADADARALLNAKISLRYLYNDRTGAQVTWFDVSRLDCWDSLTP
jgi:hypothetical protein